MRKNSIKNTRINGEVQRALSNLINRDIKDPRIDPMTSIVAVEVAPDLKTAKVYISVLGDEEARVATLKGLKSAAPFIRGQLARTVNLRNTPEIIFIMDNSIEYGVNMFKLINEVNKNSRDKDIKDEDIKDEDIEDDDIEDDDIDNDDIEDDDIEDDDIEDDDIEGEDIEGEDIKE